ncbi:MAG: hypothetical protein SGJ19_07495 [Planctomycetia bacterium]|nr:hypothetical protein [Planctomycetia bacterium]
MRSRVGRWVFGALWLSAIWRTADAQPPDDMPRVARLVERLGDASFAEREIATMELASLGRDARAQLQAALDSPDVEVRIRARKLLELLAVEDLWTGSFYTPEIETRPALEHFEAIAAQSENRLLLGERYAGLPNGLVTLNAEPLLFWPAMDAVCGQIDCRFRAHYELLSPGLAIVSGRCGQNPLAYAGPLRAQLTSARRLFQEDIDYSTAVAEREHVFQIQLEMIWEDRFQLVAHRAQPIVVRAVTDNGQQVASEQPSGGAWNVVTAGAHYTSATLRLHPPPVNATQLAELTVAWELIAVGDLAELAFDPRQDRDTHFQDDAAITVNNCRQEPGGRVELELTIARDLPIPDPQEMVFQENRFTLLDANGERYRRHGQSHALTPEGAQYKLTFIAPGASSEPALLQVKYPRIRSRRALELVFHDVPLPHARPD